MISRRAFLASAALLAAAPATAWTPPAAAGAPPRRATQVPGYFRLLVGDVEVTAVYDGQGRIDPAILHGAPPQVMAALLEEGCIDPKAGIPVAINAFLVNTGRNLMLVDTGAGTYFGARAGFAADNIRAAGYAPEQIDTILLTHLHSDHALGLANVDGGPAFLEAVVRVRDVELAYWLDDALLAQAPPEKKRTLTALRQALSPYAQAGRLTPFALGQSPAPGVEAVPVPGHTPGHCGFRVGTAGQSLLAWGDVVHALAVQFPRPAISLDYDVDQPAAVAARADLMARLAGKQEWIAGAHLPFPGIGRIRARECAGFASSDEAGFAWVPAAYGKPDQA